MTGKELAEYRKKLLEKLYLLKQNMQDMGETLQYSRREATGDLTNIPTHIADISADTFAQDMTLGLLENKGIAIKEIEKALDRIEKKTYGVCEECGKEIGRKRLEYIPYARLCISCKMEDESRRQHSRYDEEYYTS